MSRRAQFALYVLLSVLDFAATVYLVTNGYADEMNPLINGFVTRFSSFALGLAIYKLFFVGALAAMIGLVHRQSPATSRRLLVFANVVMLALGAWHLVCIRLSAG